MNAPEHHDPHVEVERLITAAGDALELLDRINRSDLDRAIPVLAEMVINGDLARLAHLARFLAVGCAAPATAQSDLPSSGPP